MLNKKNNKQNNNNSNKKLPKFNFYWIYGIVALLLIGMNATQLLKYNIDPINENKMWQWIDNKKVKSIEIVNNSEVKVYIKLNNRNDPEFTSNSNQTAPKYFYFEIPKDYATQLYQKLLDKQSENQKKGFRKNKSAKENTEPKKCALVKRSAKKARKN